MSGMNSKKYFSKRLSNQKKSADKKKEAPDVSTEAAAQAEAEVVPGKTTKLAFFKQYYTYQVFLELHPSEKLSVDDCFSKTILYIMRWFRSRLGDDALEQRADILFLKEDYPDPENYMDFNLEESHNINGFSFIDFESAYTNDKTAWLVCLTEPDNGNERKDIYGRTFTTEIFVYKLTDSVALGIRESCREPETNTEDAVGYRPGFVRDIFIDKDIGVSEYGIGKDYSFSTKPIMLNGKSSEACEKLYRELIASDNRQMPILFVPEEFYRDNKSEVDRKTQSLLGFTHVVVWEGSSAKLFTQTMKSEELHEVAGEGQLIFYRTTNQLTYDSDYYESDRDNLLEEIKQRAQKETCRKTVDFGDFVFKPSWWDFDKNKNLEDKKIDVEELSNAYEMEIAKLNNFVEDLNRDKDVLQRKNDNLESENKDLDKSQRKLVGDICRKNDQIEKLTGQVEQAKEEASRLKAQLIQEEMIRKGMITSEKERFLPIINLPQVTLEKKDELIAWVEKYYSETIVIHPNGVKSLKSDNRNIDWHRLCMMIHFLSGWTKYRNNGGDTRKKDIAPEYDPENSGYKVERTSSGKNGAIETHKDKYTISYDGKDVLLDMHLKYGKGSDVNMIRVYFYYDADKKKSVIGYMPGHLPTKSGY